MSEPTKRIFVAIPAYDGKVEYTTFMSIQRAFEECVSNGWHLGVMVRGSDALICRARDVLVAQFLSNPENTDLLFVDADVAWKRGSFSRLMRHDVDFVGGPYRMRSDPEDYAIRCLPNNDFSRSENGLIEVAACPTGFMRIRRSAIECMVEHRKDDWYDDNQIAPGLRIVQLFTTPIVDHKMWGEDFSFCKMWRELGGKVYIDPDMHTYHTGSKLFGGSFADFLQSPQFAGRVAAMPVPKPQPPPGTVMPVKEPSGNRILDLAREAAQ
jgi:hypothetical protein